MSCLKIRLRLTLWVVACASILVRPTTLNIPLGINQSHSECFFGLVTSHIG